MYTDYYIANAKTKKEMGKITRDSIALHGKQTKKLYKKMGEKKHDNDELKTTL